MANLIQLFFIFLAAVLQISLMPSLSISSSQANLILLVILSLIFISRRKEALWWVIGGGILLDLFTSLIWPINLLSYLLIYVLIVVLLDRLIANLRWYIVILMVFLSSLIFDLPFYLIRGDYHSYSLMFFDAIYNVILGLIIYYFFSYYYSPKKN